VRRGGRFPSDDDDALDAVTTFTARWQTSSTATTTATRSASPVIAAVRSSYTYRRCAATPTFTAAT
jgi:hypothetical protein